MRGNSRHCPPPPQCISCIVLQSNLWKVVPGSVLDKGSLYNSFSQSVHKIQYHMITHIWSYTNIYYIHVVKKRKHIRPIVITLLFIYTSTQFCQFGSCKDISHFYKNNCCNVKQCDMIIEICASVVTSPWWRCFILVPNASNAVHLFSCSLLVSKQWVYILRSTPFETALKNENNTENNKTWNNKLRKWSILTVVLYLLRWLQPLLIETYIFSQRARQPSLVPLCYPCHL